MPCDLEKVVDVGYIGERIRNKFPDASMPRPALYIPHLPQLVQYRS